MAADRFIVGVVSEDFIMAAQGVHHIVNLVAVYCATRKQQNDKPKGNSDQNSDE